MILNILKIVFKTSNSGKTTCIDMNANDFLDVKDC